MEHSIATDEAGYGPNLGPLVIGASRWKFEGKNTDPRNALSDFVFDTKGNLAKFEAKAGSAGLMIADSKAVYSTGRIKLLERGVLSSLCAIHGRVPETVGDLLSMFSVQKSSVQEDDYFRCEELKLPLDADVDAITMLGDRIANDLSEGEMSLEQLSVALVFPKRFNSSIELLGNKANCLTTESLSLISTMIGATKTEEDDSIDIRCDKHGGRNRYAPAIQECFDDAWVTIEKESRPLSCYSFNKGKTKISFTAKGESWLPIALASMCAKYVREIFMHRWNRFWIEHLPHLKPTKGYPMDAKRFKKDIAVIQKKIGIPDEDIWRIR